MQARNKGTTTTSLLDEHLAKLGDLSLLRFSIYQTVEAFGQKNKTEMADQLCKQQQMIEHEKLTIEQERLEWQKGIDEKVEKGHIMAIDLSTCNPTQCAHYKKLQQQILSKVQTDMSDIKQGLHGVYD